MELSVDNAKGVAVVVIDGDHLDASNAEDFKRSISPVISENKFVLLDMSKLEFVDSTGLGAILSCLRRLSSSGGELKLCCMTRQVQAVFELSRMHRIIDIKGTQAEALQAFGK